MKGRCPECGGTRIEQYLMPYGPMWCLDCGFRVEEKMEAPNPFLEEAADEWGGRIYGQDPVLPAEPAEGRLPLGEAIYQMVQAKKRARRKHRPSANEANAETADLEGG